MNGYKIRRLQKSEFHLLLPLMKDCFGLELDIEYFEWKYLHNPAGEFVGFVAISEENEISAYYGVIPETYKIDEEIKVIYQSCDTMTHSKHRRKGLFKHLANACFDYLREREKLFVMGFGGGQSTPGFIKFGWTHCFDIRNYFYPLQFTFLARMYKNVNENIEKLEEFEGISDLIIKSNFQARVHSHKTLDVFNWRISNPRYKYEVLSYKENKEYLGYICFYKQANKIFLFDYYFKTPKSRKELFHKLKSILFENKFKGIVAFCQENSAFSKPLKENNFIANPFSRGPLSEKTPFILYTDKYKMNQYSDSLNWSINSFDHDAL